MLAALFEPKHFAYQEFFKTMKFRKIETWLKFLKTKILPPIAADCKNALLASKALMK